MPTPEQLEENRLAFNTAKLLAQAEGRQVCGTFKADGTPVYFTMPEDASEADLDDAAFALREGRPRTDGERMLSVMAQAKQGL